MLMTIPVDQIGYDVKFYPRVNGREDWYTVHQYKDALLADPRKDFPPVVVVKATGKEYAYALLDGVHRTRAYHHAGREAIPAVIERLPESKWFARSVELNTIHGRRLDVGDKAWIAVRLEEDGFSIKEVADLLQMRVESLEKIKAMHVVKLTAKGTKNIPEGRGNRTAGKRHFGFLKAPFTDHAGMASAESALAVQSPVCSMSALNILDSAIAVLEAGVDLADADIAERVATIRKLVG